MTYRFLAPSTMFFISLAYAPPSIAQAPMVPVIHATPEISILADSYNGGNASEVADQFVADGMAIPPSGNPFIGTQAIRELWQSFIDGDVKDLTFESTAIINVDQFANDLGHYSMTVPDEAGTATIEGTYVVVWESSGGVWMVRWMIWNVWPTEEAVSQPLFGGDR